MFFAELNLTILQTITESNMSKNRDNVNESDNVATQMPRIAQIVSTLRSPSGCAWDREQTHHSLKQGLLEEAFEVLDAIDSNDMDHLCDELGDLLFHILIHSEIAAEAGKFELTDVISGAIDKLTRRHPHVFGDPCALTMTEAIDSWRSIKRAESGKKRTKRSKESMMPALIQASRLLGRIELDPVHALSLSHTEINFTPSNSDTGSWSEERRKKYVAHSLMSICEMAITLNIDPESTLKDYVSELVEERNLPD